VLDTFHSGITIIAKRKLASKSLDRYGLAELPAQLTFLKRRCRQREGKRRMTCL